MYGKVQPDALGRPHRLWFSKHAAQVIGEGRYRLELAEDRLHLIPDPHGRPLTKTRTLTVGALLDALNTHGELTNQPFPIRRRGGEKSSFELLLHAPDPALSTRSEQRETALPMQVTPTPLLRRQSYSAEEFVRLFVLAELARNAGAIRETDLDAPDELLARLPRKEVALSRFGSFGRLRAFMDFAAARLTRAGLTPAEAFEQLDQLLEKGG